MKRCGETCRKQTCSATVALRTLSVLLPALTFSALMRDSSQDLEDTEMLWEAGLGFQQKAASYLV